GATKELPPHGRRIVRGVDAFLNVATRLRERLPHLTGHEIGDLLLPLDHEIADPAEHVAARRRGRARPDLESALGGGYGAVDIGGRAFGEATDDVPRIRRVHIIE